MCSAVAVDPSAIGADRCRLCGEKDGRLAEPRWIHLLALQAPTVGRLGHRPDWSHNFLMLLFSASCFCFRLPSMAS
jgi:hypothetical protein